MNTLNSKQHKKVKKQKSVANGRNQYGFGMIWYELVWFVLVWYVMVLAKIYEVKKFIHIYRGVLAGS